MRLSSTKAALAITLASLVAPVSAQMQQTATEIAGPANLDRTQLTGEIAGILETHRVAGAHVVVTFGPDTVLSRSFGIDPSTGDPFRSETTVRLASASKLFTALAVASLVESNAVSLDETLGDLDPTLPKAWHDVPIWCVLNHTSGLPMIVSREEFGAMDEERLSRFSMSDLRAIIGNEGLDFSPGEQWRYQQSGYAILAQALAKRASSSWPTVLEERILAPASLGNTSIGNDAAVFDVSEDEFFPHVFNYPAFFASAGGIQTTGEDTRRLLLALARGDLIAEDGIRALTNDTRRLEKTGRDADGEGYGMGVAVQRFGYLSFFGHSGGGGLADIRYAPESQIGIAVVTNRAGGTGAATKIADLIASTLVGKPHESAQ